MKVSIVKGNLIIEMPLQKPVLSKSKKSLIIASTGWGVKTGAMLDGKLITVGLSAYVPAGDVAEEPAERFQP